MLHTAGIISESLGRKSSSRLPHSCIYNVYLPTKDQLSSVFRGSDAADWQNKTMELKLLNAAICSPAVLMDIADLCGELKDGIWVTLGLLTTGGSGSRRAWGWEMEEKAPREAYGGGHSVVTPLCFIHVCNSVSHRVSVPQASGLWGGVGESRPDHLLQPGPVHRLVLLVAPEQGPAQHSGLRVGTRLRSLPKETFY